jgi:hypothetical protein
MKSLKTLALIMVLVLTASVGLVGCQAESEGEVGQARLACIELMQKVPVYGENFEFWDVKMLREDPDLADMYQIWYERHLDYQEENYSVDSETVDYLGTTGLLDIFIADYDVDAVRDAISVEFYRDTSYEEIEVWRSEPSHDPQSVTGGWVLAEGLLVRGANNSNVDEYLRVVGGEDPSMYDSNAAALLERMPEGVTLRIFREFYQEGLVISGNSVEKVGETTLRWSNFYMFESAEAAAEARASEYFTGIEEEFEEANEIFAERGEPSPFSDFSLELDGEFIEWSVVMEEEYMIAMLFYG